MKKHILIYGLLGGLLIALLKLVEYRFLVVEHSIEIYGGLIAVVFAGLGILGKIDHWTLLVRTFWANGKGRPFGQPFSGA